jgi:hypothetical protein
MTDYAHPTARHSQPFQTDTHKNQQASKVTVNRTITIPRAPKTMKRGGLQPLTSKEAKDMINDINLQVKKDYI